MSKKEVSCNLTESDLNNLNTAIECIKVNQNFLLKNTIEQTNAIAVTVTNIYEIVSKDRGSMIKLSKETGLNKGRVYSYPYPPSCASVFVSHVKRTLVWVSVSHGKQTLVWGSGCVPM